MALDPDQLTTDPTTGTVYAPDTGEAVEAQTEYDLLFPVITLEEDTEPPDSLGEELVDDIADFAEDEEPEEFDDDYETPPDQGEDFAFDWDSGEFYGDERGDPLRVTDDEAVIEWAQKALNTEKGAYPIYPPEYGTTVLELLGAGLPDATLYSELTREIIECLRLNPRIVEVEVPVIQRVPMLDEGALFVTVDMTLDTGETPASLDLRF